MASIDWGMIGLGAVIGMGCRKQLKACGRIATQTAASLAGVAAQAASQVAKETEKSPSAEEVAAAKMFERIDQRIAQFEQELADQNGQGKKKN